MVLIQSCSPKAQSTQTRVLTLEPRPLSRSRNARTLTPASAASVFCSRFLNKRNVLSLSPRSASISSGVRSVPAIIPHE